MRDTNSKLMKTGEKMKDHGKTRKKIHKMTSMMTNIRNMISKKVLVKLP